MSDDFFITGLGESSEAPPKMVSVTLGNGKGPAHVAKAGEYDETVGFDQQAPQRAAVPQIKLDDPLPRNRSGVIDDPDWEEYQQWKRWKASQAGNQPEAVGLSNQPIGVRSTVRIMVDETKEMPPTGYPVGLNGQVYLLKPNVPIDVPEPVLEIIKHAVVGMSVVDPDDRLKGFRDRPRIPWRFA